MSIAALRETLTRLIRDEGVAPVSVVTVLAHLLGEIAVDDAATHHGVHDAEMALGPVLRQVRQAAPDVLLLDLTMPDVDGWAVLESVRAEGQLKTMRVALLTAESDEMIEHRARRAGAHAYLVKPLEGADLTRAVQRLLDDREEPA